MFSSTPNRAFQAYSNNSFKNYSVVKTPPTPKASESSKSDHTQYADLKTIPEKILSTPSTSSPKSVMNPVATPTKRPPSINGFSNFLPRRKSQQMTALAFQRQSLWMSIAKNNPANTNQLPTFPLQKQTNLMRKKILRLLLVFSYLLSISLFAIALATFYGFFWTGYSTTQAITLTSKLESPTTSIISLNATSTLSNIDLPVPDNLAFNT